MAPHLPVAVDVAVVQPEEGVEPGGREVQHVAADEPVHDVVRGALDAACLAPASRKCCHPDAEPPNVATREEGDENGWCSTPGPGTLTRGSTAAVRRLTLGERLASKRAFGLPSQRVGGGELDGELVEARLGVVPVGEGPGRHDVLAADAGARPRPARRGPTARSPRSSAGTSGARARSTSSCAGTGCGTCPAAGRTPSRRRAPPLGRRGSSGPSPDGSSSRRSPARTPGAPDATGP